jgi:uncharacterized membrane protein YesL
MLRGFLDNDSLFGQIMLRCWAIIICNLCFVITVLPIVTAGAGWAAMDFALMNTLKNKDSAAPFRDFWKGFATNFKQATISWICSLVLLAFLAMEWYWCRQFGGIFDYIKIGILMIAAVIVITMMYLFPTMAAFKATIPQLIQDSIYFMFKKPLNLIMIVFVHIVPMALTYMDLQRLPLYAFLWTFFGFAAVSLITVNLLLAEYMPYLETKKEVKEGEAPEQSGQKYQKTEKEILDEMQKLGM